MGSFLSRALLLVFGYAYPAYECFKVVEKNKPEIEKLKLWCKYWVPLYSEAKLAFFIYLWYHKSKGTIYIYNSCFQPYVAKHETEIDRNLLELKVKAGEIAVIYWQKAMSYGQTRFFEILEYFSSQSASQPHFDQQQNAGYNESLASVPSCQASATNQKQSDQLLQDSSSTLLSQQQREPAEEAGYSPVPATSLPIAICSDKRMPIDPVLSLENGIFNPSKKEKVSKEAIPVARGKWRLFRTTSNH